MVRSRSCTYTELDGYNFTTKLRTNQLQGGIKVLNIMNTYEQIVQPFHLCFRNFLNRNIVFLTTPIKKKKIKKVNISRSCSGTTGCELHCPRQARSTIISLKDNGTLHT